MVRFLVSVTESVRHELKKQAQKDGYTVCGLVRQILHDWLKHQKE